MAALQWGKAVSQAFAKEQGESLATLLDPFGLLGSLAAVRSDLQKNDRDVLTSLAKHARRPEHPSFSRFCSAFAEFIREADPAEPGRAFELLDACSQPAQLVLRDSSTPWFAVTARLFIKALLVLAVQADAVSADRFESEYTDKRQKGISSRLFSMIGVCTDEDATAPRINKRQLILFLANTLYRIFFRIKADMQQFASIDTRLVNVKDFLENIDKLPKAEQVTYEYFKGRAELLQRRLTQSMIHLNRAFDLCTNAAKRNKRRILIYLTTVSICRGRLPAPELLEEFALADQFAPLLLPFRKGDYVGCVAALDEVRADHLDWGNYFLLKEKLEVLCWRTLVRRVSLLLPPSTSSRPPLSAVAAAAKIAFGSEDMDGADALCICASLCEQRLILGYCSHKSGVLVLSKGREPFTPIALVNTEAIV